MARATVTQWINLVAGLAVGAGGLASAARGGDNAVAPPPPPPPIGGAVAAPALPPAVRTAPAAPGAAAAPVSQAAPAAPTARAKAMLQRARAEMAQGNFEAAEALARDVDRMKLAYGRGDDTPAKVLADVHRLRGDEKALLAAARAALQAKDYDRAERLARAAEKAESGWTLKLWGDSPTKVIREVRAAREQDAKSRPAPKVVPVSHTEPAAKSKAPEKSSPPSSTSTQPPLTSVADTEEARKLLAQGRQALADGDKAKAQSCCDQARRLKPILAASEDTPDKLQAAIAHAPAQPKAAPTAAATKGGESAARKDPRVSKDDAVAQLRRARALLAENKLDEAAATAQRVKAQSAISWGLFDDTPDKVLRDIQQARTRRDREESVQVLAEGRRLLQAGDLDGASRAAYRADKLHGPYSVWDLGDRPSRLLADVQAAREKTRKPAVPPPVVTASTGTGKKDGAVQTAAAKQPAGDKADPATPPIVRTEATAVPAPPVLPPGGPGSVLPPAPVTADATRARAQQLLASARKLYGEGKLLEARQQAIDAQKLNATFGPGEDTPELALLQLAAAARQRVDGALAQATEQVRYGKGDAARRIAEAEATLAAARQLAAGFGQDLQPIDAKIEWVRQQRSVAQASPATPAVAAPPPVVNGTVPGLHGNHGQELLEKARLEIRKGELATARRLAQEAFAGPYGVQQDAVAVLRTIDAEEFSQKSLQGSRAFDAALAAYNRREYGQARALLEAVDARQLDPQRQGRLKEIMLTPEMQPGVATAAARGGAPGLVKSTGAEPVVPPGAGRAQATDAGPARAAEPNLLNTAEAMRNVAFQKLRQEGLERQREAAEKFRTGQTDAALEVLQDYLAQLADTPLSPEQVALLKRPVESRLQQFKLLKAQRDFIERDTQSVASAKGEVKKRELQEQNKQKQLADLMKKFNTLYKEGKYLEAERYAMLAHELDPDNGMAAAAVSMAKMQRNRVTAKNLKQGKADFALEALNDTDKMGPAGVVQAGLAIDPERSAIARARGEIQLKGQRKTDKEREIESRLQTPVNLSFNDAPLKQVLDDLRSWQGINIVVDELALQEEGISLDRPVRLQLEQVSLKSALNLLLRNVRLTYVIRDEVLQITTEAHARGKLVRTTYQVADLVLPIENFGSTQGARAPVLSFPGNGKAPPSGPTPVVGAMGLRGGQPAGQPTGSMYNPNGPSPSPGESAGTWSRKNASATLEDTLIKLVTGTIEPRSWQEMGGPGTIDYHPMTMSLVINQTPDIQEQVADLLAALRRLQDQEVAIEVRLISIADDFFERIGVDFDLNFKTDKGTARYEPQITTGAFKPTGYINDFSPKRFIAGLQTPGGAFTNDLDIPINTQTFAQAIPPFGGYTGVPGFGGLTLGLGFLSDIQVFLFMEAVQGDVRTNVMQAPKLTMFNGQTATLQVTDSQFFVTGVDVQADQGLIVYTPQVQVFPLGVTMTLQPVISADRRFVRVSPFLQLQNLSSPIVQLFPITVPIFPQLDGTGTGPPIVFTNFVQQPVISSVSVQTTVNVPDGGTVVMGGLKRLSEGRNEYGPPILSKLPYINRLFKNVGYGREAHSLLIMVTPRIIIMEEEETRQTGVERAPPSSASF